MTKLSILRSALDSCTYIFLAVSILYSVLWHSMCESQEKRSTLGVIVDFCHGR